MPDFKSCGSADGIQRRQGILLLSVLFVSVVLLCLGCLTYWLIAPATNADIIRNSKDIITGTSQVLPEPQEKTTYFVLLAALPPSVLFSYLFANFLNWNLNPIAIRSAIAFGILAFTGLLIGDPFWSTILSPLSQSATLWVLTAIIAAISLVCTLMHKAIIPPNVIRAINYCAVAIGILIIFGSKVFDVRSIGSSVSYFGHYEAAAYAVSQIANGSTCLVDVVPQYGCFGEFMAPVVRLLGVSTLSITFVFAALQCACFLILIYSASRLITEPSVLLVYTALVIIVTNRIFIGQFDDPFFQGLPVRMLFPVLSLLVAAAWIRRQTPFRAMAIGCFAGLSIIWNLDTGAVVATALSGLILFGGSTSACWQMATLFHGLGQLARYLFGIVIMVFGALIVLRLKGGAWPLIGDYISFQQLFFGSGFASLPMSPLPSLWTAFAGSAVVALSAATARIGKGHAEHEIELTAYIAVMALGLLSYYIGRSHWQTLGLVAWPFLLLAAALTDLAWKTSLRFAGWGRSVGRAAIAIAMLWSTTAVVEKLPYIAGIASQNWDRQRGALPAEIVYSDVEYVRALKLSGSRIAVIAKSSAPLFADAGLRSSIVSMSWIETLRISDATRQINQILDPGVDNLLLESSLAGLGPIDPVNEAPLPTAMMAWVKDSMPAIRKKYTLIGQSPSKRLSHLVLRERSGSSKDLFDDFPDR